jgi:hypothetical protein
MRDGILEGMELRAGMRLYSAVSEAEVVVVKAPSTGATLGCGGQPLLAEAPGRERSGATDEGPVLGKRYTDDESGAEVLCVKAGAGGLTADDRPLVLKGAKPLPASD